MDGFQSLIHEFGKEIMRQRDARLKEVLLRYMPKQHLDWAQAFWCPHYFEAHGLQVEHVTQHNVQGQRTIDLVLIRKDGNLVQVVNFMDFPA